MSKANKSLATWFLRRFCPPDLLEEIEGDLFQKFERDLNPSDRLERSDGYWRRRAERRLVWNVIRFFRPGIVLRNRISGFNRVYLFQNNLKIGVRSLLKRKINSFINIFGLAVGMAVCLVIWRYVEFELSYDSFNKNAKNIYRISTSIYSHGEQWIFAGYDLAPSLQAAIPEIKTFVRKHSVYGGTVVSFQTPAGERRSFRENRMQFVDSTFLKVFSFETIYGNSVAALSNPSSAVIAESVAHKYFGNENPLGRILKVSGYGDNEFQVTAVIKDVPANSHFMFDILLTMHNLLQSEDYRGHNEKLDNFLTYVELNAGANPRLTEKKMQAFLASYVVDIRDHYQKPGIKLTPLLDIHLQDHFTDDAVQRAGVYGRELTIFMLISLFVIIIAWINYINLSTARAIERAKEVGIRKAIGISRMQLIGQFFTESVLVNALAAVIAIILAFYALPLVNSILDKPFHFDLTSNSIWLMSLCLFLAGIVFSGIYPSFVLSSFRATEAMKGKSRSDKKGFTFRQSLVILQFSASLILIVGAITVLFQMKFMENHKRGYDSEQMLIVEGPSIFEMKGIEERIISFKNDVKKISSVLKACTSDAVPGTGYNWGTHMHKKGALRTEIIEGQNVDVVFVDTDFPATYGLTLKSGKIWHDYSGSAKRSLLVNEASLQPFYLGSDTKALEERLIFGPDELEIGGVLRDYNWYSLKSKFTPMVFWPQRVCSQKISIKISGEITKSISQIENLYKNYFEGNPFDYYFLDDNFNQQYKNDQSFGKLVSLLSAIAVIISCLGLFGLASFTTLQKTKEISIRKVLGASVSNIVSLLSWQFMKPVLLACLITIPVAGYFVNDWLSYFAFRIAFSWELVGLPFLMLLFIALLTITVQTINAAIANPVKGLKSE